MEFMYDKMLQPRLLMLMVKFMYLYFIIWIMKNLQYSKVKKEVNVESFDTKNLKMDEVSISELYNHDKAIKFYGGITLSGLSTSKPIKADSLIVTGY